MSNVLAFAHHPFMVKKGSSKAPIKSYSLRELWMMSLTCSKELTNTYVVFAIFAFKLLKEVLSQLQCLHQSVVVCMACRRTFNQIL